MNRSAGAFNFLGAPLEFNKFDDSFKPLSGYKGASFS
jgi:hypothetical protein